MYQVTIIASFCLHDVPGRLSSLSGLHIQVGWNGAESWQDVDPIGFCAARRVSLRLHPAYQGHHH